MGFAINKQLLVTKNFVTLPGRDLNQGPIENEEELLRNQHRFQ